MGTVLSRLCIRGGNAYRYCTNQAAVCTRTHWCKLLILGGGTGGCSVAWRFAKKLKPNDIIVLEPSGYHYYQPMFTLVAAGINTSDQCRRPLKKVLPPNVVWLQDTAEGLDPDCNVVYTRNGDKICYEYMVVALGLNNEYDYISGLKEALDSPNSSVSTIYSSNYCCKTWCCIKCHRGGHAVFTFPSTGGKCSGSAQKIMYLADDYWRMHRHRHLTSITYNTGGDTLFGVEKYGKALHKVANARDVAVNFRTELVEVRPTYAVFDVGEKLVTFPYNFLHVTPPMCAPAVLRESTLVNETGFMDVNKHTLQHVRYPNVYGLGDCTNTPNSKTASAVAPQSYTVEQNLTETMAGRSPTSKYNGYGSCPMLTSYKRGILTEFMYDKQLCETFPFDQAKERRIFFFLKKYVYPYLYWNRLIKGKWNGPQKIRKLLNPLGK